MADFLLVARLLLAGVFVVAGLAKLADPAGSRKSMADFGLPQFLAWLFVWVLPSAEIVVGVGLVPARSASWAAVGALALLVFFITGIGISLARGRKADCHCFGQLYSAPANGKTLARNGALAGVAALIAWQQPSAGATWFSTLNGFELAVLGLTAVMAIVAAGGVWLALQMLQQNGRLMLRLETIEAKLGLNTPEEATVEPEAGLPVDSPAPSFSLAALDGETVTLEMLEAAGKPVLLVFSEPGCGACDTLLPDLAQAQRGHRERLAIVPISRGDVEANRAKSAEHELENVLLQKGSEVSDAYEVSGTPSAVLIRGGKIASKVAVGGDAIRSLMARASLPPAVKKGDPAPVLPLPDLSGAVIDLSRLRGSRRLLLFWNPECGFCQGMLDEMKAWEQSRLVDSPELLVISSGSLEENHRQGFRARVLLDQNFAAGQVFDAEGTPAAVLLDEDGRVASEVAVGAPEVLALAGAHPVRNSLPEMQSALG